jgi:hypothetical protein
LWFWDVRQADELPNRRQYWNDIASILDLDIDKIASEEKTAKSFQEGAQLALLHVEGKQLIIGEDSNTVSNTFLEAVVEYAERKDLFDNNQRIGIVNQLASKYYFFHPHLEFLEVFWEKGGFDLIAGNPPWVNIELDESGILSENYPEISIRDFTAPVISDKLSEVVGIDNWVYSLFIVESLWAESTKAYLKSPQNYSLLVGQRNNLS